MNPQISVILNTARSGYAMLGFPEKHHFEYTLESLKKQTFRDFELVISDYIHNRRNFDFRKVTGVDFPVYHVPVTHSVFQRNGYCAISATKNSGIMHSTGGYLVFLDDCCSFEPNFLHKVFHFCFLKKLFPNALHVKKIGGSDSKDANGNPVRDCRYILFDHHKTDTITNNFHLYGYSTCSAEAALELNGFDEMYDGSRQLEDIDFGERLKIAGYSICLNRDFFVEEQEHTKICPPPDWKTGRNPWCQNMREDDIEFKPNLKCNGPLLWMKSVTRSGVDRVKANHRAFTDKEKKMMNPCYLLDENRVLCHASNLSCNHMQDGRMVQHMTEPDSELYYSNPPVFSLALEKRNCCAEREKWRVL